VVVVDVGSRKGVERERRREIEKRKHKGKKLKVLSVQKGNKVFISL